jgi:hypothetical protein
MLARGSRVIAPYFLQDVRPVTGTAGLRYSAVSPYFFFLCSEGRRGLYSTQKGVMLELQSLEVDTPLFSVDALGIGILPFS